MDVKGGAVEDIHNGNVLMELGGAKSGRLASLDAGYDQWTLPSLARLADNRVISSNIDSLSFRDSNPSTDSALLRFKPSRISPSRSKLVSSIWVSLLDQST